MTEVKNNTYILLVNITTELELYRYVPGDSDIALYGIYFCSVTTVDNNDEFKRRLSDLKQKIDKAVIEIKRRKILNIGIDE